MNLHEDRDVWLEVVHITADHFAIPAVYVEKDYWVTWVLRNLSRSAFRERLIFKGGTALSKAHQLIHRFSEDIDLAAHVTGMSGNQVKQFIRDAEATLAEGLSYIPNHPAESKHGLFRKTWHNYPRLITGDFVQASPQLLLEINAFTTPEPFSPRPIKSLIAEALIQLGQGAATERYGLGEFSVNVLNIERTIAEKIMGLVRASREKLPDVALKARIRHIYDLCLIKRHAEFAPLFRDNALLEMLSIVETADREQFSFAGNWLDEPISETMIFAHPEQVWSQLDIEFRSRFAVMVYNNDLPANEEILLMLKAVHQQLTFFDIARGQNAGKLP
ncbi:nucleotidyl transferase AbiEii/AbiGii toxin family protein [Erwiniaceae bacterium L1_54_6]|jgi:hypothetical protein|nr:nucleotidyl transferase AbiEii/AbiGii toxin family protein [Erwiniaceae bacterium L1_54_6]